MNSVTNTDIFCLDTKYSTMRCVTIQIPIIQQKSEDKFESVWFLPEGEGRKGEGGLRTKGYYKKSQRNKPLITIITVVFNGEKHLEKTLLSVLNQTFDNVEYIIIDGCSTDGTLDIIKKYEDKIDYWISEKDKGIYDAMNKGIYLATGDWINFMNAGDYYVNINVIHEIFYNNKYNKAAVLYGNVIVDYGAFIKVNKAKSLKYIKYGMPFNHQSVFIDADLHKKMKYNSLNKITADFEFLYNLYQKKHTFIYVNKSIAQVTSGGISDLNRLSCIYSYWNIVGKYKYFALMYYPFRLFLEVLKIIVKKIISNNMIEFLTKK